MQYLAFRTEHVSKLNPAIFASEYNKVNALFEKALILLNKMPRVWEMYLQFLVKQPAITLVRRTFDRALRALPITQHNRIWALYVPFSNAASGDTAVKIWRRYIQVHPEEAEDFIELLIESGLYTEAAISYVNLLNNVRFASKTGKGHYELWSEMVDLLVDHASEIEVNYESGIDVESIIRSGIARFPDQRGKLWVGLATYWIRRGSFERARDTFEQGITTVMTVRDFALIFDSYTEFEESIIKALMESVTNRTDMGVEDEDADFELDVRMMRFARIFETRFQGSIVGVTEHVPFIVVNVIAGRVPRTRITVWVEIRPRFPSTCQLREGARLTADGLGGFPEDGIVWIGMRLLISVGPGCSFPALTDTDDGWVRVGLAWFGRCRVWGRLVTLTSIRSRKRRSCASP